MRVALATVLRTNQKASRACETSVKQPFLKSSCRKNIDSIIESMEIGSNRFRIDIVSASHYSLQHHLKHFHAGKCFQKQRGRTWVGVGGERSVVASHNSVTYRTKEFIMSNNSYLTEMRAENTCGSVIRLFSAIHITFFSDKIASKQPNSLRLRGMGCRHDTGRAFCLLSSCWRTPLRSAPLPPPCSSSLLLTAKLAHTTPELSTKFDL